MIVGRFGADRFVVVIWGRRRGLSVLRICGGFRARSICVLLIRGIEVVMVEGVGVRCDDLKLCGVISMVGFIDWGVFLN